MEKPGREKEVRGKKRDGQQRNRERKRWEWKGWENLPPGGYFGLPKYNNGRAAPQHARLDFAHCLCNNVFSQKGGE